MRPIDADAIVFDYGGLAKIHPYDFRGIAEYFAKQIDAMPTIEPERKTQWISCDDKVPIVSGEFLVTLTDADGEWVSTAEWNTTFGGRWQDIFPDDGYRDISNVIAWMPLPEPYQAERREE